MTPTRELAMQIFKECKKFTKSMGLRAVCVYGGTGISEQVSARLEQNSPEGFKKEKQNVYSCRLMVIQFTIHVCYIGTIIILDMRTNPNYSIPTSPSK